MPIQSPIVSSAAPAEEAAGDMQPPQVAPRQRVLLVCALVVGFGLAILAAVLCIVGMGDVRYRLDTINQIARTERETSRVIEQVGHSLVAFTATAIDDLSPEERAEIFTKTDWALADLKQSVGRLQEVLKTLPAEHQEIFAKAIASITRSWQELRDEKATTIPLAEKAYHFLGILEDLNLARECLTIMQGIAAERATHETSNAFDAIRDTISLITGVIIASVLIAGFGVLLVRHYIGLVRNANVELADANKALRDAKRLAEDANRAKSAFLSTFSHELRTPLNAIIGFSSLLSSPRPGMTNSDEQHEYAEHIHASGIHLLNLINDILDFTKAGAGKLTLSESSFRLGHLITQVAALFRVRAAEAGLQLVVDVNDAPLMFGDERRVRQILLNLMSNSMKFTQSGGTITLSAGVRNGSPFLSVIDTGIGIAPDDLPRVLQPFGQVDSSLSRNYEGTGLGLPLVATMAELHGGELQLESKVGAGTKAIIIFPATRFLGMDIPQERAA